MTTLRAIVKLLRPRQWIKNCFVFISFIFAGDLRRPEYLELSLWLFAALCLASSACYGINDVADAEADRAHPLKRKRPVASGALSPAIAILTSVLLAAASLVIAFRAGRAAGLMVLGLITLNLFYSAYLKHQVLLDVFAIAVSFLLRVLTGGVASSVRPSHWMILMSIFITLMLALGKRRAELLAMREGAGQHRHVLTLYRVETIDQMLVILITLVIASFSLFTVSDYAVQRYGTDGMIYTLPLVVYGLFRYLLVMHTRGEGGDPTELALTDRPLLICVLLWLTACIWIVYTHASL